MPIYPTLANQPYYAGVSQDHSRSNLLPWTSHSPGQHDKSFRGSTVGACAIPHFRHYDSCFPVSSPICLRPGSFGPPRKRRPALMVAIGNGIPSPARAVHRSLNPQSDASTVVAYGLLLRSAAERHASSRITRCDLSLDCAESISAFCGIIAFPDSCPDSHSLATNSSHPRRLCSTSYPLLGYCQESARGIDQSPWCPCL